MSAWMEPELDRSEPIWAYMRPPLIGSTLFALTDDRRWLQLQFDNFADGGSQVRSFFHRSLALVAPRLAFGPELLLRMDMCMKNVYFYMDIPLALYVVSRGEIDKKLAMLKRWQGGFMNPEEKAAVEGYLKGHCVRNPLQYWMLEKMAYVAMRTGCCTVAESTNSILPSNVELAAIWERMRQHELFAPHIELRS